VLRERHPHGSDAHGAHSPAFARKRDRAFLTACATDIEEVASALRRDIITVQEALLCDAVQAALAIDVGLAAQQVLAVVRIIEPRTFGWAVTAFDLPEHHAKIVRA
jgi:hypothetical protein